MAIVVDICDETTAGDRSKAITLEFPSELVTVREIIRARVYQEVQDHNRGAGAAFRGLVKPSATEISLNGAKEPARREIDWKAQYAMACGAYERNTLLVLVGARQTASLDEVVTLERGVDVTFLRLVALIGG